MVLRASSRKGSRALLLLVRPERVGCARSSPWASQLGKVRARGGTRAVRLRLAPPGGSVGLLRRAGELLCQVFLNRAAVLRVQGARCGDEGGEAALTQDVDSAHLDVCDP